MKYFSFLALPLLLATSVFASDIKVIKHNDLPEFKNNGNTLVGVATPSLGSPNMEVWRSSIAPESKTPIHIHNVEEIFVLLSGTIKATVFKADKESIESTATITGPATFILPANKYHQLRNVGKEASDQIVVMKAGHVIKNIMGEVMNLPWRK